MTWLGSPQGLPWVRDILKGLFLPWTVRRSGDPAIRRQKKAMDSHIRIRKD